MSTYIYEDGATHNDHHKEMTVNVSGKADIAALMKAFMTDDAEEVIGEEVSDVISLPAELNTPEAEALFSKLYQAGMVDEKKQPVHLTNAERGVLAFQLAVRLNIPNQWQVFGTLWRTTPGTLRSAYNRANDQLKTSPFLEKLKKILS